MRSQARALNFGAARHRAQGGRRLLRKGSSPEWAEIPPSRVAAIKRKLGRSLEPGPTESDAPEEGNESTLGITTDWESRIRVKAG